MVPKVGNLSVMLVVLDGKELKLKEYMLLNVLRKREIILQALLSKKLKKK